MKHFRRFYLPLFLMVALASSSVFVGCSDSDPEGPDGTEVMVPKMGSTYSYTEYEADANGNKDASTEQGVVAKVEATGVSIGGKTGALKFSELYDDGTTDTSYVVYESNGDMTVLLGVGEEVGIDPVWVKIPFGSRSAQTFTLKDSVDFGSGMVPVMMTITTTYLREEKVTIQGTEMDAWVGEVKVTGTLPSPFGGTIAINSTGTLHFVPQIGYIYKSDDVSVSPLSTDRTIRLLLSYSLAS